MKFLHVDNEIKMPHPLLIFSQSDYLIRIVDINSHTKWQTVQIQISWLLEKPTDLDLHCLQRQAISGFSRSRVKLFGSDCTDARSVRLAHMSEGTFSHVAAHL